MSTVFEKPKLPPYIPPPTTATQASATDPTISRSAAFAARGGESFVGTRQARKPTVVKSTLLGN